MSFTASDLHLNPVAPGRNCYYYQTSDTMATVFDKNGDGYFDTGPNAAPGLAANDLIWCLCSDGNMWLKVVSVNATSGVVKVRFAGGNLPIRTHATGTAAGDNGLSVGYYEIGTQIATGSRDVLPVPYAGAEVIVRKMGSGTRSFTFDAGACASNISWVDGTSGGGTGVTYDGSAVRRLVLRSEGEYFHVVGSSTSRWRLYDSYFIATGDGCASVIPQEGATVFMAGT